MDKSNSNSDCSLQNLIKCNLCDKNFDIACQKVAEDLRFSKFTIVDLIEELGILLTDISPEKRKSGLLILTKVIEALPHDFFNTAQVKFISGFFADRIKDHHQVVPVALKGSLVISNFANIPSGCLSTILQNMFQNISCQQQHKEDRYIIYQLFDNVLDKGLEEVQSMGFDFVYGVITAVDGERDPYNLLYLFSWLPKFIKSVNLGHLTEEMFEVVACYFPVDFKTPSEQIKGVSRDLLAKSLCPCLCCISDFAQFCLPLALEKLSSQLKIAKLDSLDLLMESCNYFLPENYVDQSTEIWSLLQKEILNANNHEILQKSLETLSQIINKLSQSEETSQCFNKIVKDVTDTVKGNLRPDTRLFIPSSKILLYLAKASEKSANLVIEDILPQLMNTYNITRTPSHQALLLECITDFAKVYIEVMGSTSFSDVKDLFYLPILSLEAANHSENVLKKAGFASLKEIAESMPEDLREHVYETLNQNLIIYQDDSTKCCVVSCLEKFCNSFPNEVDEKIFHRINLRDGHSLDLYLNVLCKIRTGSKLAEKILKIFVNCLKTNEDLRSVEIVMKNLKELLNKNTKELLSSQKDIVDFIVNLLSRQFNEENIEKHQQLLQDMAIVLEIIVGTQESQAQKEFLENYLKPLIPNFKSSKNPIFIILLHGMLCRIRKEVLEDFDIIEELCKIALQTKYNLIFELSARLIANLVNKLEEGVILNSNKEIIETVINTIEKNCNKNGILLFAWITKGLVEKGSSLGESYTEKIISFLNVSKDVAFAFEIIMNDNCCCLSTESYCNKRLLYRQRFFTYVIDRLCKSEKQEFLISLGYLLKESPKQVVVLHFKKILKNVILCLERVENPEILNSILDILHNLLLNKEQILEEHLQEFVPRFIKLSRFKTSMKVRTKALQCLQAYASGYVLHKLLPFKQQIVNELIPCLDDPKRIVRKEAVLARNYWFLLDSPT